MKIALITLSLILSSGALAETLSLSFKDQVEVKKVVMDKELLIDLYELQHDFHFGGTERMIAGKFETSEKKTEKKSYIDDLRSRLSGSRGMLRL